MFTRDSLLEMAAASEIIVHSPVRSGRSAHNHYDLMLNAFHVALFMEQHGIDEAASIGPFGEQQINQNQQIIIKKGSPISSASQRQNRNAGRDYKVTVMQTRSGRVQVNWLGHISVENMRVVWMSDGYLCSTEATNVRFV